jgi:anti-sigma regulatory factor (Ser/Thr protein kinase)
MLPIAIEIEKVLPSTIAAISEFMDWFMLLIANCGCIPERESDVEIAVREALENAVFMAIMKTPASTLRSGSV